MYRTDKIAVALTAAWVRNGNGAANQEPKDIADFYRAVCEASDFFLFYRLNVLLTANADVVGPPLSSSKGWIGFL